MYTDCMAVGVLFSIKLKEARNVCELSHQKVTSKQMSDQNTPKCKSIIHCVRKRTS